MARKTKAKDFEDGFEYKQAKRKERKEDKTREQTRNNKREWE